MKHSRSKGYGAIRMRSDERANHRGAILLQHAPSILTAQNHLVSEPFVLLSSESFGEDVHKLGSSRHVVEGVVAAVNLVPEELVVFGAVVELWVPNGGNDGLGLIVDARGNGKSDWLV